MDFANKPVPPRTPREPREDGEILLKPQQLLPGVDYLYCPDCGQHVGCTRLQPGLWEVQCPRCVGECGLCGCDKTGTCHGQNGAAVPTHMYVVSRK